MNKILLVARREYRFNLQRRSFLFAVFGIPLFTFVMWFIIFAVTANQEEDLGQVGKVGYVDQAGVLENPIYPDDSSDLFVPYESQEAARAALDDKRIGAYFALPEDYLKSGAVQVYSYSGIPDALSERIDALLLVNLSRNLPADVSAERIQNPVDATIQVADSGRELTEASIPALVFIPLIFVFVFLMSSGTTSGFLMSGVVEEKTNRVMEILVTSVTPLQLLLGKVIGLGALGLTQVVIWGAAALLIFRLGQDAPFLAGVEFPADMMLVFLAYFILSYFLLASLMAGLGAVAVSEEESRQYASILSLVWVIPFFFMITFINEPNSSLAVALSLIPFTAPTTMLLRLGFGMVPGWQIMLSLLILLMSALFIAWASARVFRWSLLMYGKRISIREIWRLIRRPAEAGMVTSRSPQEGAS